MSFELLLSKKTMKRAVWEMGIEKGDKMFCSAILEKVEDRRKQITMSGLYYNGFVRRERAEECVRGGMDRCLVKRTWESKAPNHAIR